MIAPEMDSIISESPNAINMPESRPECSACAGYHARFHRTPAVHYARQFRTATEELTGHSMREMLDPACLAMFFILFLICATIVLVTHIEIFYYFFFIMLFLVVGLIAFVNRDARGDVD